MAHPAPGWYPDQAGQSHYWDGYRWATSVPAAAPGRVTINYGFALLAILSLIGTLIPSIGLMSTADQHNSAPLVFGVLWGLWGGMWTIVWAAFAIRHTMKSRG